MSAPRLLLVAALLTAGISLPFERRDSLIDENRVLPSEHPAINYWQAEPYDAVARLQKRIDRREVTLAHDARFGYLPAVLKALDVPQSSQVLVFSKTSFQAVRIFPRQPRSIYHNEEIAVGWVRGGDVVELASLDPKLGVVFYTLSQIKTSEPRFEARTTECVACHAGPATVGVPGLFVRSVHPDISGTPQRAAAYLSDHRSPLEERWGGWYVAGTHGEQKHMGNAIYGRDGVPSSLLNRDTLNARSLHPYISSLDYLTPHSDIVSLLVLEHQTRMTNLLVRLGYETRIALAATPSATTLAGLPESARRDITNTAEELLRYMLFTDEAPLTAPITGVSGFAEEFSARGAKDPQGRSLHQLDLRTRLLRYPLSYMIDSDAFTGLPPLAKDRLYRRLADVLTGKDQSPIFARLSPQDRQAILAILRATHPAFTAAR